MALQIGDFLVDRLSLGDQVGLDFTVANLGDNAVKPAFLGSVEFVLERLALSVKLDPLPLCCLFEVVLFILEPGKHSIHPVIRQRDAINERSDLFGD